MCWIIPGTHVRRKHKADLTGRRGSGSRALFSVTFLESGAASVFWFKRSSHSRAAGCCVIKVQTPASLLHQHAGDSLTHGLSPSTKRCVCVCGENTPDTQPSPRRLPDFKHCWSFFFLYTLDSAPLSLLPEALRLLDGKHQLLLQLLVALVWRQVQSVKAAT